MATVKFFSLSDDAIEILEQIPKSERSEFVAQAILEMAKKNVKLQIVDAIRHFPRFKPEDKTPVVDVLRKIRQDS